MLDAFLSGFAEVLALRARAHRRPARRRERHGRGARRGSPSVTDRYHLAGGDELERRVDDASRSTSASRDADLERPLASLSGGERGRLHLGVVLAQEPGPAPPRRAHQPPRPRHHRLARGAPRRRSAAPCSSCRHDRAFLDNVCPHHDGARARGASASTRSRYSEYAVAREEDLARERELVERQQDIIAKTEDFIRKNIAGPEDQAGAEPAQDAREARDARAARRTCGPIAEKVALPLRARAAHAATSCSRRKGLGADARRAARSSTASICSCGAASASASSARTARARRTLLKLLAGHGRARGPRARVRRGTNLAAGLLRPAPRRRSTRRMTAVEEIRSVRGDLNVDGGAPVPRALPLLGRRPAARRLRLLGRRAAAASRSPSSCSSRATCSSSTSPPTTSTSPPPRSSRRRSSASRAPCILVSHDRRFLEGVTTRVVRVRDGAVEVYPGGFRDYEETLARRAAKARRSRAAASRARGDPRPRRRTRAASRGTRSEPPPATRRARPPSPRAGARGEAERARRARPRRTRSAPRIGRRAAGSGGEAPRVRGREGGGPRPQSASASA